MLINYIGIDYSHGKEFEENRQRGMGYWLLVIVKTRALFEINGEKIEIKKPSYVLLQPSTPVRFSPSRGNMVVNWMNFSTQSGDVEWLKDIGIEFDKAVPLSVMTELESLCNVINYEHYLADNVHNYIEADLLRILFLMLVRQTKKEDNSMLGFPKGKFSELNNLRMRIYAKPEEVGSVDEMAAELGVSRSGLQHMYKKMFNIPISTDVISARVNSAKLRLASTKFSLREIAKLCGYQNEFYFMRQFKEVTGMTPTEYRETL